MILFWNLSPEDFAENTNKSLVLGVTGILRLLIVPLTIAPTGTFPVRFGVKVIVVLGISTKLLSGISDLYSLANIVTVVFVKSVGIVVEKYAVKLSNVPLRGIEKDRLSISAISIEDSNAWLPAAEPPNPIKLGTPLVFSLLVVKVIGCPDENGRIALDIPVAP